MKTHRAFWRVRKNPCHIQYERPSAWAVVLSPGCSLESSGRKIQTPNVLYVDMGDVYMDILRKKSSHHTLQICVFYCLQKIKTLIPKPNSKPIKSESNMQGMKTIVLCGELKKKKKEKKSRFLLKQESKSYIPLSAREKFTEGC